MAVYYTAISFYDMYKVIFIMQLLVSMGAHG